jgi:2-polyprenyl-3-methyl-5-hydroxy-6-metoxy-1,4-benzoquinol methylase
MIVSGCEPPPQAVEWEETDCLLCGAHRRSTLLEAPEGLAAPSGLRAAVVRCEVCGLCYTCPRPTAAVMHRFYPDGYPPHEVRPADKTPQRRKGWRRRFGAILGSPYGPPCRRGGRLLDFGCGGGKFLEQMYAAGCQVVGVDMVDRVVERIREELGLHALARDLGSPELAPSSFDVITMRQSLEHVHDPLEVLRQARRLLVPGGKLMVWVPNLDSVAFRWFGSAWFGLDLPRHLTHFTPATLRRMVGEAGFQVERLRMIRHSSWLQRSAIRAHQMGNGTRATRWLTRRPVARLATWYAALTHHSDCLALSATRRGG